MVCSGPIRACYRPAPKRRWLSLRSSPVPLSPWLPLEGVCIFPCRQLVLYDVILLLLLDIFLNRGFIEANRAYIVYPSAQNFLLPNLYFKFACLSKIIKELLPFRYPIKLDTLILGGILTSICTWSGIRWPSIISTPLYLHKSRKISRTLSRNCEKSTFLLYFGVKTI